MRLSLFETMQQQNELYRPTAFWLEASKSMIEMFQTHGLENFRALDIALSYFVPTYGAPGNGLGEELTVALNKVKEDRSVTPKQNANIEQFLSGYSQALADYRTLLASNYNADSQVLLKFSESSVGNPIEQFEFDGKYYSRSSLNYLLGLSFLSKYMDLTSLKIVLEIGGGFGTLGEVLLKSIPETKYINIDIPPTLFASEYYLSQVFGENSLTEYENYIDKNVLAIETLKKASVLPSWKIQNLTGEVDLFVNFISFQEMEPHIVQNYLDYVSRLNTKWILLRNMREGKQQRKKNSVGVENPIFSEDYIKMLPDYKLIDTNVWPFGFKTTDGYHSELMLFKRNVLQDT